MLKIGYLKLVPCETCDGIEPCNDCSNTGFYPSEDGQYRCWVDIDGNLTMRDINRILSLFSAEAAVDVGELRQRFGNTAVEFLLLISETIQEIGIHLACVTYGDEVGCVLTNKQTLGTVVVVYSKDEISKIIRLIVRGGPTNRQLEDIGMVITYLGQYANFCVEPSQPELILLSLNDEQALIDLLFNWSE